MYYYSKPTHRDLMFTPKSDLDFILLSIVKDFPDGITGYAIIKEIKVRFGEGMPSSPGTIYPRLKKLVESGDLAGDEKNYLLTDQGYSKLSDQTGDIITKSLTSLPKLFKQLLQSLPFEQQILKLPEFADQFGCGMHLNWFTEDNFENKTDSGGSPEEAIQRLRSLREKFVDSKKRIQRGLDDIQKRITSIDQKIKQMEQERKSWQKPKIQWENDGERQ